MYISGEFIQGLVVSGTIAYIGLLGLCGTLYYNTLACLYQLAELGDSGQAVTPDEIYFGWHI